MAEVIYVVEEGTSEKRRRIPVVLIACLLTVLLVGGATLAFLTDTTEVKRNVFTAENIEASLSEDNWDATGKTAAAKTMPGVVIDKDPVITNENAAGGQSEWVAIKITLQKANKDNAVEATDADWTNLSAAEVTAFLSAVGINDQLTSGKVTAATSPAINSNWSLIDGATTAQYIYMYKDTASSAPLAPQDDTAPLFNFVGVLETAGSEDWDLGDTITIDNFMTWLNSSDGAHGQFRIKVEGAAVQGTGVDAATAKTELIALFS